MRVLRRLICSLFLIGLATTALSAPPSAAAPKPSVDFDGDGLIDVASGAYDRIDVAYGTGASVWIGWRSFSATEVGSLGQSMAAHDLNGDGYTDLVVGSPNHTVGGKTPGAVFVLYGSERGLRTDNVRRLSASTSYSDALGWSVAVMVGSPTLIVASAPGLTVSGHKRAGGLAVWPVDAAGVPGKRTIVTENSSGIPGVSEAGDEFGYSIAASGSTLVVGTPYENVGKLVDAGTITVLERKGAVGFKGVGISQNSSGVPGAAESHDQFGFSVAIDRGWIAASAPWETVGKVQETGAVQLFRYQAGSLKPKPGASIHQNSPGVPGTNERIDHFGEHLLVLRCGAGASLAIGTPIEKVGKKNNAGLVTVVPLGSGSKCPARSYDGSAFGGAVESEGVVGYGIGLVRTASDHDDLLAVTTKKSDSLVGRVDPVTGKRVATYRSLWGSSEVTGFANPAS